MFNNLHDWRRIAGCVTLVMACVFMAGWMRSHVYLDMFSFTRKNTMYQVASGNGSLAVVAMDACFDLPESELRRGIWTATPIEPPLPDVIASSLLESLGFYFISESEASQWSIPYWSIVLPLVLLSAGLLFSKPRQASEN